MRNKHKVIRDLSSAIVRAPDNAGKTGGLSQDAKLWTATYQGSESVDANLSYISLGGQTFHFVPRLAAAWSTAPAVGTNLAVLQAGGSLLILGPVVGDTSKASV